MSKVCKNYTLGINKFDPHTKNAFEFKQTKICPLFVLKFHQLFKNAATLPCQICP